MKVATIAITILALAACCGAARAQESTPAERRQAMIEECLQNHGSQADREREVDTELRAEALPWGARVIHVSPSR
jgi:cytochrome c556